MDANPPESSPFKKKKQEERKESLENGIGALGFLLLFPKAFSFFFFFFFFSLSYI